MNLSLLTSARSACLLFLIVSGCNVRSTTEAGSNNPTPFQSPSQTNGTSDLINSGLFDNNPIALKAWLKFIEDGKHRAAKGEDFKFSEAEKSELRSMFEGEWYPRINHPALTGNISRRHGFKDLAIIVVDSTKSDSDRFSVVIFNAGREKRETPSVHWLQRNCDLSSALLSWHNNWPVLVFYRENGSSDPYYINWNENTKQYFLGKQQIGPDARPGRLRETVKRLISTSAELWTEGLEPRIVWIFLKLP